MTFILAQTAQIAHAFSVKNNIYSYKYVSDRKIIRSQEDTILFEIAGWERRNCILMNGLLKAEMLIYSINNTITKVEDEQSDNNG